MARFRSKGYSIGKSSIHRYGADLERRMAAIKASTEAARAIAQAAPDDEDLRSGAVISLIQTEVFDTLMRLQEAQDPNVDAAARVKLLSAAAKNVATLTRASVNLKRWQIEIRDKVRAAAAAVEKLARKGGLSAGAVDSIRREILGITQ